jgi:hypothetical protein
MNKIRKLTEEHKKRISDSHKGKSLSEEHKKAISNTKKKNDYKSWNWKGDNVKLVALHAWVRKRLPKPDLCVSCKEKPPYDLANISQEYKRDINDFEWLCRKCHIGKEKRFINNRFKGYVRTNEYKKRMSEIKKGIKPSQETKLKMSLSAKKSCLNRSRDNKGHFISLDR